MPIEINGNLHFTQNWNGETSQNFSHSFIVKKQIFQIDLFNGINCFLIIIYLLIQFKMFIYSP